MAPAPCSKRRALVSAVFALAQLTGASSAGWLFVRGDCDGLASASTAFTGALLLLNRWYFRGWRELHPTRRGRSSVGPSVLD